MDRSDEIFSGWLTFCPTFFRPIKVPIHRVGLFANKGVKGFRHKYCYIPMSTMNLYTADNIVRKS